MVKTAVRFEQQFDCFQKLGAEVLQNAFGEANKACAKISKTGDPISHDEDILKSGGRVKFALDLLV